MSDAGLFTSRDVTWSLPVPMFYAPVGVLRESKWRRVACGFKVSAVGPYFLIFDYQEAFHCCLVIACINKINMISIQCHRVGQWWAGKPEFEIYSIPARGNRAYIPFNYHKCRTIYRTLSTPPWNILTLPRGDAQNKLPFPWKKPQAFHRVALH